MENLNVNTIKHQQGKSLRSSDKRIVLNLFNSLTETNPELCVNDIVKMVAKTTGISERSIYRIRKEYFTNGKVITPSKTRKRTQLVDKYDEFTKCAIRGKVHNFYFLNELPTADKVLQAVNDDPDLPDFTRSTIYNLLKLLNFKYTNRNRNSRLIERDDIILWRRQYLRKIREMRSLGRKIYYLDETWINAGHTKNKVWKDCSITSYREAFVSGRSTGLKNPSGKGKRIVLVHIGSNSGFLNGGLYEFESKSTKDYHEEMDGNNFKKWFEKILSKLESNAVVVMDNAPYHSAKIEKIPNCSWKKADIISWLEKNRVRHNEKMLKIELLDIVKKIKHKYDKYIIDEMAKEIGVDVLRLPPYHCNLNPIELIWADMKGYIARHNTTFKLSDVRILMNKAIEQITEERWRKCIEHIEKEEQRMWELDEISETVVEKLIITNSDESDINDYFEQLSSDTND
ncbi:uncharacterized protein [Centruroides vittatus]|uniref:uncharacterized protein n=2 Tax=Centruroides vittatus TaxID=120091 RepID=UPI00350EFA94